MTEQSLVGRSHRIETDTEWQRLKTLERHLQELLRDIQLNRLEDQFAQEAIDSLIVPLRTARGEVQDALRQRETHLTRKEQK